MCCDIFVIIDVESQVMVVLWQYVLCSLEEIVVVLGEIIDWYEKIICILFNWLFGKVVVSVECDGWCYFYCLLFICEQWQLSESCNLFDCVFGGKVVLLLVYFFMYEKFSKCDIVELCVLIDVIDVKEC